MFYLPDRDLLTSRLTVGQHLESVRRRFRTAPRVESIATLELDGLLARRRRELSVAERRRSEVGLALQRDPFCLVADEPFRELAPMDRTMVAEALRRLAGAGCAVVVTGHEVGTLFDVAEHVIWMTAGTTRELGPPDRARAHPEFRREYLGPNSRRGEAPTVTT